MKLDREPLETKRLIFGDNLEIPIPLNKYADHLNKPMYIGKDGYDYPTSDALFEANRRWMTVNYQKITKDPRFI